MLIYANIYNSFNWNIRLQKKKINKKSFKFFILKEMILGAGFVCCFIQIDLYFLFDIIFPVAFNK